MQQTVKPSKRKEALTNLSREHHYGLLLVWKIRQGIRNNIAPARIADFTLFFFEHDLQNHFKTEETDLFSKLDKESSLLQRALQEHQSIRDLINAIHSNKQEIHLLTELADTLEKHIRFEEREMFNYLQLNISEPGLLIRAGKHNDKPIDVSLHWPDKFWELKKCDL